MMQGGFLNRQENKINMEAKEKYELKMNIQKHLVARKKNVVPMLYPVKKESHSIS